MSEFHSQFGEDRWIAERLKVGQGGTFCEVGAYDGEASSNTLYFEEHGWLGVCIEPLPEMAALCRKRRKAVTVCCAAGLSGIRPFYLGADLGRGRLEGSGNQVFPVPVLSLEEIILSAGFKSCDLLSIDTEGTELEVWQTRGRFEPNIVIIEYLQWGSTPCHKVIVSHMEQDGYHEVHRTEANLIFWKDT